MDLGEISLDFHYLLAITLPIIRFHSLTVRTNLEDVRVFGEPEQLAGLSKTNAMQGGQVVTTSQDAHVAKLLLCEKIPQGATAAQVTLVYLKAVALLVHFENHLQNCETSLLL